MGAPQADEARRGYWVACPACAASNPVNALACWHCETALPHKSWFGEPPAEAQAQARSDGSGGDGAVPSFFPVLKDEVSAPAANDAPTWDSLGPLITDAASRDAGTSPQRSGAGRRWALGASALVAAAALAFAAWEFAGGDGRNPASRAPTSSAEYPPPADGTTDPAGTAATAAPMPAPIVRRGTAEALGFADRSAPVPAPTPTPKEARSPKTLENARAASARSSSPASPPAPTRAPVAEPNPVPCTPNVAALGLCSSEPR